MSDYRKQAIVSTASAPPPELVYVPVDRDSPKTSIGVFGRMIALTAFLLPGVVLRVGTVPKLAYCLTCIAIAWKTRPKPSRGFVLRVEDALLTVRVRNVTTPLAAYSLEDLLDVTMDTKTIERVLQGGSAVPVVRFTDTRIGPKIDTARIALIAKEDDPLMLGDAYLAKVDAIESLGEIRRFLRAHGWVPASER